MGYFIYDYEGRLRLFGGVLVLASTSTMGTATTIAVDWTISTATSHSKHYKTHEPSYPEKVTNLVKSDSSTMT
jgi:hypothetical protein